MSAMRFVCVSMIEIQQNYHRLVIIVASYVHWSYIFSHNHYGGASLLQLATHHFWQILWSPLLRNRYCGRTI